MPVLAVSLISILVIGSSKDSVVEIEGREYQKTAYRIKKDVALTSFDLQALIYILTMVIKQK